MAARRLIAELGWATAGLLAWTLAQGWRLARGLAPLAVVVTVVLILDALAGAAAPLLLLPLAAAAALLVWTVRQQLRP